MNKKKAANYIQDLGALIALVLLIVVIGAISPEFRTVGNFLSLLRQSSIKRAHRIWYDLCHSDRRD